MGRGSGFVSVVSEIDLQEMCPDAVVVHLRVDNDALGIADDLDVMLIGPVKPEKQVISYYSSVRWFKRA